MRALTCVGVLALTVACAGRNESRPAPSNGEDGLGLTEMQLLDADLIDATGRDLGDVDGVVRDPGGRITHLLVEIEDTEPDRYVHVPIEGLTPVRDGMDWDVRSRTLSREDLLAMPEQRRPGGVAGGGTGEPVALGLTERQLLDADLVDDRGRDLGDVEGLRRSADGRITHLLVEIEDTSPDRFVEVPIAGMEATRDGSDWDVRAPLTRDDLMALPEYTG